MPEGGLGIQSLDNLQIVNGGQTTASLYHAAVKDRANIDHVQVQMKLTVVEPDRLDEIVPLISRYANSQNTVNEADFSANHPFHVEIERLSRAIWAPAVDGHSARHAGSMSAHADSIRTRFREPVPPPGSVNSRRLIPQRNDSPRLI